MRGFSARLGAFARGHSVATLEVAMKHSAKADIVRI